MYSSGEDASEWQVFAEFEARGMQPVEWVMMPGFALVGPSGFKFEDDSLEDNEFYGAFAGFPKIS